MTLNQFIGTGVMAMEVPNASAESVRAAIQKAEMPEKLVHDIRPADAFKRAMQKLVKVGVVEEGNKGVLRDKCEEGPMLVSFQFTPKFLRARNMEYASDKAVIVSFRKDSGEIVCDNDRVKKLAEELFAHAKEIYPSTRLNDIARDFCESQFTRLRFRDGVYFVPRGYDRVVDQLRTYYKALGARFQQFSVGQFPDDRENLIATIVDDMKQKVTTLRDELESLKEAKKNAKDGDPKAAGLTAKMANNRLRELKVQLNRYRELARVVDARNEELLKAAGAAGAVLEVADSGPEAIVAMAIQGRRVSPIALELAAAAIHQELPESVFRRSMTMPEVEAAGNVDPIAGSQRMSMPTNQEQSQ